jgi:hypothetical protein
MKETSKGRLYATTNSYSKLISGTTSKVAKTEYVAGAGLGSTWKVAFASMEMFVKCKTGVFVHELLEGEAVRVENRWRVRLCGQGGSVGGSVSREGSGETSEIDGARANEETSKHE